MHTDVVKYFLELVCIDSESRNERKVVDKLKADLAAGCPSFEDEAFLSMAAMRVTFLRTLPAIRRKSPSSFVRTWIR